MHTLPTPENLDSYTVKVAIDLSLKSPLISGSVSVIDFNTYRLSSTHFIFSLPLQSLYVYTAWIRSAFYLLFFIL